MGLVDVETLGHASHEHNCAGRATHSASAKSAAAFPLHAVLEFLNALLQLVFVAKAEILSSSLRAADADGFRGTFCTGSVQRQAGNVAIAVALTCTGPPPTTEAIAPAY